MLSALAPVFLIQSALKPFAIEAGGLQRKALVHVPSDSKGAPIVFVFHGHGGTGRSMTNRFAIHKRWPEAIVVYPQGLPTAGKFDPEGKQAGWQKGVGEQGDRDLAFFDKSLEALARQGWGDPKQVFVTGHSNGGGFTYLLWRARGPKLRAIAPSAAGGNVRGNVPLPCMHIAGKKDTRVPFENQMRVTQSVRITNGCMDTPSPWQGIGERYESPKGAPFVSVVHEGGHEIPADAGKWIVAFFKECASK